MKILIIEFDYDLNCILKSIIEDLGCDVKGVTDYKSAQVLLKTEKFDKVLITNPFIKLSEINHSNKIFLKKPFQITDLSNIIN